MKVRTRLLWAVALIAVFAAGVAVGVRYVRSNAQARALRRLHGANLLLVTLDTTRADRLGCYGYSAAETPVLDAMVADGVLFERCVTPTAYTLPSHASILTGLYPTFHGVRLNGGVALADVHATLAERLAERGYRTGAFIGAFVLDGRWGLEQGFEHYDDDFQLAADQRLDLAGVQRPADKVVDAALGWLEQEQERPFFAWVHLYDPHTPYEPPEPFKLRYAGSPSRRYDGELAFTDSQVGRLLGWLEERGVDDNTVVVVVGDHGEGLGSHGESEHGYFIYEYAVLVPLMMRLPVSGLGGVRVSAQVRTIDVAPTILELLGTQGTDEVHGESLVPLLADPDGEGPPYAYIESVASELQYGWAPLYGLSTSDFKLIDAPRSELYDLQGDPDERDNLFGELPELASQMRAELDRLRQESATGAPETEDANLDEGTMQMLAALGYVGGSTEAEPTETRRDPKDMLHVYEAIGMANQLIYKEDHAGAAQRLEGVLEDDPRNPQARFLLAMSYDKTGRRPAAKVLLDEILVEDPDSVRALIAMAGILSSEDRGDEVVAICQRALVVDERNSQAMALIADVYMDASDHAAALPFLEQAVAIQPKLTRNRNNLAACRIGVGQLSEARAELVNILETYPKFPRASFNLGLLHEQEGRASEARKAYETELEHYPEFVPARFNLGRLLMQVGELAAGEEEMRRLVASAPDQPRPYMFLARALLARSGDLGEAERLVHQGLERSRTAEIKALGHFLLADIYSRQGRRAELEAAVAQGRRYQAEMQRQQGSRGGG